MYHIALCDDRQEDLEYTRSLVADYFCKKHIPVRIETFASCREVQSLLEEEIRFDIIILDIDMPDMDGMELAAWIRQRNTSVILIFLSAYEQFVFESIHYTPFRYIRKIYEEKEITIAMNDCIEKLRKDAGSVLNVRTDEGRGRIYLKNVKYFEREGRKVRVSQKDGSRLYISKTIKELESRLEELDCTFVKIHSGCLVNAMYVEMVNTKELVLGQNEKMFISRRNRREVKEKVYRYWGESL